MNISFQILTRRQQNINFSSLKLTTNVYSTNHNTVLDQRFIEPKVKLDDLTLAQEIIHNKSLKPNIHA